MHIIGSVASARDYSPKLGDFTATGQIIYAAPTMQSWGRYIEIAPVNWFTTVSGANTNYALTTQAPPNTLNTPALIGGGQHASELLTTHSTVTSPMNIAAKAYRGGGFENWTCPTTGDFSQVAGTATSGGLFSFAQNLGMSTELNTDHHAVMTNSGAVYETSSSQNYKTTATPFRPVRYFGLPSYNVGDTGPGGGLIFYKAPVPKQWGQYLEMAPAGWYSSVGYSDELATWSDVSAVVPNHTPSLDTNGVYGIGSATNIRVLAQSPTAPAFLKAKAYNGGGFTDWRLPAYAEWAQVANSGQAPNLGVQTNQNEGRYWASREMSASTGLTFGFFSDFNWFTQEQPKVSTNKFVRPVRSF